MKRKFFLISMLISVFILPGFTASTECIHHGDVDFSGELTPADALAAFTIYLGTYPDPSEDETCAADCNESGGITPQDALCIFQHYVEGTCDCSEPLESSPWPDRVFAPYVDATAWPPFDFIGTAETAGVLFYNLGFIVAQSPQDNTATWGTYYEVSSEYLLPEIIALRNLGGEVMVSFGGAANTEISAASTTAAEAQEQYQSVIDTYDLAVIDFDIEGVWIAHPESIEKRSLAIAGLQADAAENGRHLEVFFTLPVLPSGLTAEGLNVLQSALDHGVDIQGVNIMAMDYGDAAAPNPDGQMGEYAIQAAQNLFAQLQQMYADAGIPKPDSEIWGMLGITPMIGLNDVTTEIFYQEDAAQVVAFARQQSIRMLSLWSANRDRQCPEGQVPYVSSSCSSILQDELEFCSIFATFQRNQVCRFMKMISSP